MTRVRSADVCAVLLALVSGVACGSFPSFACAQFCAHHQTPPSVTECHSLAGNPYWTRHLCHSVTTGRNPCKLLVLRATITWAQGVRGSNPRAPTNLLVTSFQYLVWARLLLNAPALVSLSLTKLGQIVSMARA